MWVKYNKRALQVVFGLRADINGHGWGERELFTSLDITALKWHRRLLRKDPGLFYTDQEKKGRCLHTSMLSKHLGLDFGWMILLLIVSLLSRLQPKNVIEQPAVGKKTGKHYAPWVFGSSSQRLLLLALNRVVSAFWTQRETERRKKAQSCAFNLTK